MEGTDATQGSYSLFEMDAFPPSPKRPKIDSGITEQFAIERCFKNHNSSSTQFVFALTHTELPEHGCTQPESTLLRCETPAVECVRGEHVKCFEPMSAGVIGERLTHRTEQTNGGLCVTGVKDAESEVMFQCKYDHNAVGEGEVPYQTHHGKPSASEESHIFSGMKPGTPSGPDFNSQKSLLESSTVCNASTNEADSENNTDSHTEQTHCGSSLCDDAQVPDRAFEKITLNVHGHSLDSEMPESEWSHFANDEGGHGFNQNNYSENEARSYPILTEHTAFESSPLYAGTNPFGNLSGEGSNEGNRARFDSQLKENANVCDGKTKAEVNKDCMHTESVTAETVEYGVGSIVTYNVKLSSNLESNEAEINVGLAHNNLCEMTLGHTAGTTTAETLCECDEHSPIKPLIDISQEPAEDGANDMAAVIKAESCHETDGVAEVKHNSPGSELATVNAEIDDTTEKTPPSGPSIVQHCEDVLKFQDDTVEVEHNTISGNGNGLAPSVADFEFCLPPPVDCAPKVPVEINIENADKERSKTNESQNDKQHVGEDEGTSRSLAEQRRSTREEADTSNDKEIHHQELPTRSTFGPAESFDVTEEAKTNSDSAGLPCEECDPASQISSSAEQLRIGPAWFPSEFTTKAEEMESDVIKTGLLVSQMKEEPESKILEFAPRVALDPHLEGIQNTDVAGPFSGGFNDAWTEREFEEGIAHYQLDEAASQNKSVRVNTSDRSDIQELSMTEDDFVATATLATDAVVPGSDSTHVDDVVRENSPVSSAYILSDCVPVVFDTFEKVQLSLDNDELEHSPLISSSPTLAFATKLHSDTAVPTHEMPMEKPRAMDLRDDNMESTVKCEDDDATAQTGRPNSQDGSRTLKSSQGSFYGKASKHLHCGTRLDNDHSPQSLASVSATHRSQPLATFWETSQLNYSPQQKLSPVDPEENLGCYPSNWSEDSDVPKFEMREKFDLVIEELCLYFEISREDENVSHQVTSEPEEEHTEPSHTVEEQGSIAEQNDNELATDEKPETTTTTTSGGFDCEQEVPLECTRPSSEGEDLMYSSVKRKEIQDTEERSKLWCSAFMFLPLPDQLSQRQPEQPKRLEPLKTCARPIRVGLSKRAKTKQLHPHMK